MTTHAPHLNEEPAEERRVSELRLHDDQEQIPTLAGAELEAFVDSARRNGLRVPLDVSPDGVVLDGRARLHAATVLGIEQVPVRIVEPDDPLEYMLSAALERRQLTQSQRAAYALQLAHHQQLRAEGHERRLANLRQSTEVAELPPRGQKTRELIAGAAGCSPRLIQDAIAVKDNDTHLFEQVLRGNLAADTAARQVRRAQRDRTLPPPPPLPQGPFELVYADPPWAMGNPDGPHAPEAHYPCMPLDEIQAMQVPAAETAILFLWAVNSMIPEALDVVDAWGFEHLTNIVWVKPSIGLGRWTRSRHELLLIARRGNHPAPDPEDVPDSVVEAPRGRHSEKPLIVYELIERMFPALSKLELFARGIPRPGWNAWGNQVDPDPTTGQRTASPTDDEQR
jgi:N6-adenosine-specific RNA methylase IME4/ParB-like chromosome segregation protein Spo0J